MDRKNIVMTGGTSGLGKTTAKIFVGTPNTRLILGSRKKEIKGAYHISLDLDDLENVRSFTDKVIQQLGSEKINILICNAGTNFPNIDTRTKDGFETTFAVNHLAHYLLIRLLIPYLGDDAKIILTTSGTHNPAERSRAAYPEHANVFWLAKPENDKTLDKSVKVNAQRAYASSKLCNLLTARYLNTLPFAKENNWKSIAYDPGPTPGTGLAKNLGLPMQLVWQVLTIPWLRKRVLPKSNSRNHAGRALADIALGHIQIPDGKEYAALRKGNITFPAPSKLAQDDETMKRVWFDSEKILGL